MRKREKYYIISLVIDPWMQLVSNPGVVGGRRCSLLSLTPNFHKAEQNNKDVLLFSSRLRRMQSETTAGVLGCDLSCIAL